MCVERELKKGWILDHGSNPNPIPNQVYPPARLAIGRW